MLTNQASSQACENKEMLAENIKNWMQQERQAGRQEGLQEAEHRALESKRNAAR